MVCPHYEWLAVKVCLPTEPLQQHLKVMETTSLKTEIDHNRYVSSFQGFCQVQQNMRPFGYLSCLNIKPEILEVPLEWNTYSPLPALINTSA